MAAPTHSARQREPLAGIPRALLLTLLTAAGCWATTLTGNVVLVDSAERAVEKHRDYSGVVVWLEALNGNLAARGNPQRRATMEQRNKTFVPHVLAVEVGATVDFPNLDPIFHNAFSNYDGQLFDVRLYAPKTSRSVVFRRAGMVRIFCNIHATMSAVIAVLPTPFFAVTGPDGRFLLQAPEGDYRFRVWQERSQPAVLEALEQHLSLSQETMTLPEIRVSEQGYLVLPHKNKYGGEYVAAPEEHILYPGVRR